MYLKCFAVENLGECRVNTLDFHGRENKIKQWSLIEGLEPSRAVHIFKLLSLCLGGKPKNLSKVSDELLAQRFRKDKPLCFHVRLLPDLEKNNHGTGPIDIYGEISGESGLWVSSPFSDLQPLGNFAYGYNAGTVMDGGSRGYLKDYCNTSRLRHSRYATFLGETFPELPLNDWLYLQYRNAGRYNSVSAQDMYNTTLTLITGLIPGLGYSHWDEDNRILFTYKGRTCPISRLPQEYIASIEFLSDFTRQVAESRLNASNFNSCDGILFVHRLENLFPLRENPAALRVLTEVFPNLQLLVTCGLPEMAAAIGQMKEITVPGPGPVNKENVTPWLSIKAPQKKPFSQLKNNFKKTRFPPSAPASGDDVVLIDVDSKIPNLALMKISRYYKTRGRRVILTRESGVHRKSKHVYASCVFRNASTGERINRLKEIHGEALEPGGSGVDVFKKLPGEIETLMPDYSLYPGMDFAMGFLTRGCLHECRFCLVPQKEGGLESVSTLDDIVPPGVKKLVLLDNNLLAYPGAADILKEIIKRGLRVNFNQTLDIRYLTPRNAELLVKTNSRNYTFTKPMYYFSLNSSALIPVVKEKIELLKGIRRRDIMFICMYGYDTTLSDDIKRFSFLQGLGVSPFVQMYRPVGDEPVPIIKNYFDTEPDGLLSIYYRLNGRNFEGFLKWVSKKYVAEFGKLHMPLVDLIFKYNYRPYKHKYIETMAGTK